MFWRKNYDAPAYLFVMGTLSLLFGVSFGFYATLDPDLSDGDRWKIGLISLALIVNGAWDYYKLIRGIVRRIKQRKQSATTYTGQSGNHYVQNEASYSYSAPTPPPVQPYRPTPAPYTPQPAVRSSPVMYQPAVGTSGYSLIGRGGYFNGRVFPVTAYMTFGREPSCSLIYPANQPGISRNHASLRMQNGQMFLTDTSSTGIFLKRTNSVIPKNQPIQVGPCDIFYLGDMNNGFEIIRG